MAATTPLLPLRALVRRACQHLLYPRLRDLADLIRAALTIHENYALFVRLCALLFPPDEVATILGSAPADPFADYDGRIGRFTRHFAARWFDVYDFDSLWEVGDGPYEWIQYQSYLPPLGISSTELAEPTDLADADLVLAALLAADLEGQEARLDLLVRRGLIEPGDAALAPDWGLPASVIRAAFSPDLREAAGTYWLWLYQATGNLFLDAVYDDESEEPPAVEWHPDGGRAYFAALRREYRDAIIANDRHFAPLRDRVDADPRSFFCIYCARLSAATEGYRRGELPLIPGTSEATLAGLLADLCEEDEASAVWGVGPGAMVGEPVSADLVLWQVHALARFLIDLGLPMADSPTAFSPYDAARGGLRLNCSGYGFDKATSWSWPRLCPAERTLIMLAGERALGDQTIDPQTGAPLFTALRARFVREHPAVAGALTPLIAGDDGVDEATLALLARAPDPALASLLRWCRGEPVGNALLDARCADRRGRAYGDAIRIPARRAEVDRWVAARRDADALLGTWRALVAAMAGDQGRDEGRLVVALQLLGDFVRAEGTLTPRGSTSPVGTEQGVTRDDQADR